MIAHPEQHTWASLANGLGIHPPMDQPDNRTGLTVKRGDPWPAGEPAAYSRAAIEQYRASIPGGGSVNFLLTALACLILRGDPGDKAWAILTATAVLTDQKTTSGWMGSEIGTRTYWKEHLIAVLVFYRDGDAALKALAGEWLRIFWAWMELAQGGERGLWLGQRSCEPGREQRDLIDGVAFATWENFPWSLGGAMLKALDLEATSPKAPSPGSPPIWKTAVPVHIYRNDAGEVAVVVERSVNNNTPAILGASTVGGKLQWAPSPPYQHVREKADTAVMQIGPAAALYRGSSFGYADVALPLPAEPRFHWIVGGPIVREEAEAPAAPTPPSVAPSSAPAKHSGGCALLLGILGGLSLWATIALAFSL